MKIVKFRYCYILQSFKLLGTHPYLFCRLLIINEILVRWRLANDCQSTACSKKMSFNSVCHCLTK